LTDLAELHHLAAFSHLSEEQSALLRTCADRFGISAGDTLFGVGDLSYETYAIAKGEILVRRSTPLGDLSLGRFGVGRLVGELGLLDDLERRNDAVANKPSELWVFPRDSLRQIAEADSRFSQALYWALWKSLSFKLRERNRALQKFFTHGDETGAAPPDSAATTDPHAAEADLETRRDVLQEQPLSNMEVAFLSTLSGTRKLDGDEVVFREGDPGDDMYVVLEGKVVISKYLAGAGVEALAILERGEFFGEMALIDDMPRSADATAHEEGAVVLSIPREVLGGILDIHRVSSPRLLKILCLVVAKRLRSTDEKIFGWYMMAGGDLPGGAFG